MRPSTHSSEILLNSSMAGGCSASECRSVRKVRTSVEKVIALLKPHNKTTKRHSLKLLCGLFNILACMWTECSFQNQKVTFTSHKCVSILLLQILFVYSWLLLVLLYTVYTAALIEILYFVCLFSCFFFYYLL